MMGEEIHEAWFTDESISKWMQANKKELSLYHVLTQEKYWKNVKGKASHWAELWTLQGMEHLEYRE